MKNEKRKRKLKSVFSSYKKENGEHKVNSNSVSFPAGKIRKTNMEVQLLFGFFAANKNEKQKTKTKCVSFSHSIENRLVLRYTDYCDHCFSYWVLSQILIGVNESQLEIKYVSNLVLYSDLRSGSFITFILSILFLFRPILPAKV